LSKTPTPKARNPPWTEFLPPFPTSSSSLIDMGWEEPGIEPKGDSSFTFLMTILAPLFLISNAVDDEKKQQSMSFFTL
jgi:hypothetical protein